MADTASYVVAYEATDQGADAMQLGIALSRLTGAELEVCLVLPEPSPVAARVSSGGAPYRALLEQQGDAWLAEADRLVPDEVVARRRLVWAESTSEGLLRAAEELDAVRVLVGASRNGVLGRFALGSVAGALLHASPVPVGLAPRGYRAPERITRITCAVGTRPGWEALLDSMVAVSAGLRVDLRFVTLVELDEAGSESSAASGSESHLAAVLEYVNARARLYGRTTTEVAAGRSVEDAIGRLDWQEGEIAFVGSSRLAQPNRIFLGATAHRMLRALPVPLVVVPA